MPLCVNDLDLGKLSEDLKGAEEQLKDMRQLNTAYDAYIRLYEQREIYLKADDDKVEERALKSMKECHTKMEKPLKAFSSGSEKLSNIMINTQVDVTALCGFYDAYNAACSAFKKWQKL